jgi:hypothetical protein
MIKSLISTYLIVLPYFLFAAGVAPGITVVYNAKQKAVTIKWQQKQPGIKSFVIQRSADNFEWNDIARQETVNFNPNKTYQFIDNKSKVGENYYRLKCITEKGQTEYSNSIMIVTGAAGSNWVIYPVPVGDVLTLQYKGYEKIKGVINVFIQNISGRVITRLRSASLNTTIRIPVSNLGKGIYDIRIVVEDEVVWNQRFVK